VVGGTGVNVSGVGSANQPFVIEAVPNVYSVPYGSSSPPYQINMQFMSEVEAQALFLVDILGDVAATILFPNGTSSFPFPVPGAKIDVIVNGGGSASVAFAGGPITWFGPAPTTSTMGLYRFIWTGQSFAGTWTPYR